MTNKIFNVYLGGTGEDVDSHKDYELSKVLGTLLKPEDGIEFVDYVFYDGVYVEGDNNHRYPITPTPNSLGNLGGLLLGQGSDNIRDSVVSLVAGQFEPRRLLGMLTDKHIFPKQANPISLRNLSDDQIFQLEQSLLVYQSLNRSEQEKVDTFIREVRNKEIKQVNLVGWSRGGVNAIRIANALHQYFPFIEVNIIAIDPVPGPTNHTPHTLMLPPNVKNYVSLIAENEYRLGFIPVLPQPKDPNKTHREIFTIPGDHDDMMGVPGTQVDASSISKPLSRRLYAYLHQKLWSWGATTIRPESDDKAVQDWKDIYENRAVYFRPKTTSIVSKRFQVKNYKIIKDDQGVEHRYRMIQDRDLGYRYMDSIQDFSINPPSSWDGTMFGLAHETCTLQRDYNDRKIADYINTPSFKFSNLKNPEELFAYLLNRYELTGKNSPLKSAVEKAKSELSADNIFLAALLNHPGSIVSFNQYFNSKNKQGWTPLMIAARHGSVEVINELIRLKCTMSLTNPRDENALDIAARYGQLESLTALYGYYSKAQQIDALIIAARYQQNQIVNQIIEWIDLADASLFNEVEVDFLKVWAVEHENIKLLNAVMSNSHVVISNPCSSRTTQLDQYAEDLHKGKACGALCPATRQPFLTAGRALTLGASACVVGYSASVLAMSLNATSYSPVLSTLFVATSMGSAVAQIALFLTFMAVFATYLAVRQYHIDSEVKPTMALKA